MDLLTHLHEFFLVVIGLFQIKTLFCSRLQALDVMKTILSERRLVVLLFVLVLVCFSLAHEDSKKLERIYYQNAASAAAPDRQPVTSSDELPAAIITAIPAH